MEELVSTTSFKYGQMSKGDDPGTDTAIPPRQISYHALMLERTGAEINARLQAQGITEDQLLSDFKAWGERRRNNRRGC